jgi:hypothetical protein
MEMEVMAGMERRHEELVEFSRIDECRTRFWFIGMAAAFLAFDATRSSASFLHDNEIKLHGSASVIASTDGVDERPSAESAVNEVDGGSIHGPIV